MAEAPYLFLGVLPNKHQRTREKFVCPWSQTTSVICSPSSPAPSSDVPSPSQRDGCRRNPPRRRRERRLAQNPSLRHPMLNLNLRRHRRALSPAWTFLLHPNHRLRKGPERVLPKGACHRARSGGRIWENCPLDFWVFLSDLGSSIWAENGRRMS